MYLWHRFDEFRKGEPERKMKGKKRSFRDNLISSKAEKFIIYYHS